MQLRLPNSDPGLDSALVLIWIEIELAYALAASTLSALKAFTESFNSGFGLGFTRGKSDSNYALSGMSGKSDGSSRTEKKESFAIHSGAGSSAPRSPKVQALRYEDIGIETTALSHQPGDVEVLRLRPELGLNNFASVSAERPAQESSWVQGSCTSSESSGEEMVIMRETELSVQHDRAPMLHGQRQGVGGA